MMQIKLGLTFGDIMGKNTCPDFLFDSRGTPL